jgi:hypothetical protein
MAVLAVVVCSSAISAQQNNQFSSNEFTATAAHDTIDVDVIGTTATAWTVWKWDGTKWVEHESNPTGWQPAGSFVYILTNPMTAACKYKITGTTSAQSGPYDADFSGTGP